MASLYQKKPAKYFAEGLIGILAILFLGFSIIGRGLKAKEDFFHITSLVTSIGDSLDGKPNSSDSELRYIKLKGHSKTFELFIGSGFIGSRPEFEQLDKLKTGDTITIYFDEKESSDPYINRLVQFIDRGQTPYFIRGSADIYIGSSAIIVCAGLTIYLLLLKKKGKII